MVQDQGRIRSCLLTTNISFCLLKVRLHSYCNIYIYILVLNHGTLITLVKFNWNTINYLYNLMGI
jgi:hypothetical protein